MPKLDKYIENEFIKDIYICINNKKNYITNITEIEKPCEILVTIEVSNKKLVEILIDIDNSFPYNLPLVKINNLDLFDEYKEKYGIYPPHITPKGFLCIADREEVVPNFNNPNGVLGFVINNSASIIIDGYRESNTHEFIDEFDVHLSNIAYTNNKNSTKIYLLEELKELENGIGRPFLSNNKYPKLYGLNLSCSKETNELNFEIRSSIRNLNLNSEQDIKTDRVLYLHLITPLSFPLPKTNKEIFSFMRDHNKDVFKKYYEYLKRKEDKDAIVIFSMDDTMGDKIFFAIKHKEPLIKGKNLKWGYRFTSSKDDPITYKSIYRLDKDKVESRTEGIEIFDKSVSIIGCGSVGSTLAESLLDMGVKDYLLIDDEYLESENIVRHIGDMNDLKSHKTTVVQKYLLNKKPYISVKTLGSDVHKLLNIPKMCEKVLNKSDINFFATGNKSVNNRVLNMVNNQLLSGTIILTWVEPYLYAGHFLIINKEIDLKLLYDNENKFKFRVITDKRSFTKKEAGCAGSYSIYSGFDTKRFVYDTLNYIKNDVKGNRLNTENILITWTGDLIKARKTGIELSNEYTMEEGNSIKEVSLL